jgi:hypothetical protein
MSQYYDRRYELKINDETLIEPRAGRQFKCVFNVLIDFGGFNSFADIAIYNLSNATILAYIERGLDVELRAGYVDNIDLIFRGNIANVLKERDGPDAITRLIVRSGFRPNRVISNSAFGKGVKLVEVLKKAVSDMGYAIEINDPDFQDEFKGGFLLTGDPKKNIEKMADQFGFQTVVENNRVVILRNGTNRDTTPIPINQENGMEGIPEITEIGSDVVTRLNPKVKIGGQIDIQSELKSFNFNNLYFQDIPESAGTGIYDIFKINHEGDTHGSTWSTKINGVRA